jgi:hypothetical protein
VTSLTTSITEYNGRINGCGIVGNAITFSAEVFYTSEDFITGRVVVKGRHTVCHVRYPELGLMAAPEITLTTTSQTTYFSGPYGKN